MTFWAAAVVAACVAGGQSAPPQTSSAPASPVTLDGQVVMLADFVPRKNAAEFRPAVLLDVAGGRAHVRFRAEIAIEGLAARRGGTVTAAAVRPRDVWVEVSGERGELRVGYGRLIWGRLDEVQPSDVINPIDTARFLLDGRSEARLPVAFARGRWFAGEQLVLEGVLVPLFRRGSFDQRDEDSSPFNLIRDAILPAGVSLENDLVRQIEPPAIWANLSGGGRVSATIGRVDVAGAVFRGFDAFGPISFEITQPETPSPAVVGQIVERHPRFTMIAGDFETVAGKWAVRGETAVFVDRQFAGVTRAGLVAGRSFDVGIGVDRRTGDYRLFASVLVHREWSSDDPAIRRADVSLVGSIERPFRREHWLARAFAIVNPADRSGFLRGLVTWKPRDNITVEASTGLFLGTSDDQLGRFKERDFAFGRLRYHF